MDNSKIKKTVSYVVRLLSEGRYDDLERLSGGQRLTATEIRQGVSEYGRKLTMPPAAEFDKLDMVEVQDATPRQWGVRVDLWTLEEGRSDLTLELTLTDGDSEFYDIQIDDLHVL